MNFLAGYLVLVAPILGALAFVAKGKRRAAAIAGALLTAVVLVYSNSVGAWVGLASGISLASLLLPRTAVSPRARVGLLVTWMGLATVAGGLGIAKFAAEWNSISVRVAAHRIGFAAIAERPLLGFGEGGYARESSRLEQRVFGDLLKSYHQSTEGLSAHSSFLQTAVERGLLGLGAFAALLASVLIAGIRGVGRAPDPARRLLLLGLLAGLVSFAVQAFTENLFDYSKVAAIFWIMGAALVHLSGPHSSPA
ncbi:MAG: O-antigen ligase family protein [Candidatus Rokubacteria bacterium]|nr:O-antigen ligase family protein [Candidatus Rokubacteria bacterium]